MPVPPVATGFRQPLLFIRLINISYISAPRRSVKRPRFAVVPSINSDGDASIHCQRNAGQPSREGGGPDGGGTYQAGDRRDQEERSGTSWRRLAPSGASAPRRRAQPTAHRSAPARRGPPAAGAVRVQLSVRRGHRSGGGREQGPHPLLLWVQERVAGGAHRQPHIRHALARPSAPLRSLGHPRPCWRCRPTRWRPSSTTRPRTGSCSTSCPAFSRTRG